MPTKETVMPTYKAPLEDIRFLLNEVIHSGELAKLPGYAEATPEAVDAILDAAAQMCEEVLFPLNQTGDSEGCHLENGVVKTPAGFKEAYQTFRESGWTGLSCNPDFGGQGLPLLLNLVIDEMVCSANLSFGMYPGLSHGAYNAIEKHASLELKKSIYPNW
jgi:alkylation response protein AidB-like acyl-CoA dehydrogenase